MVLPAPPGGHGGPPGGPPPGLPPSLPLGPPAITLLPPEFFQREGGESIPDTTPARPKAPTIDEIQQQAELVRSFYQNRDQRMDDDADRYNMTEATGTSAAGGGELYVRNIPATVVEKVSNMLGSEDPAIQMVAPREDLQQLTDRIEDTLRFAWDEWERKWQQPRQGILRRAMAHYLALRGWLTMRIQYDPTAGPDEFPVRLFLVDPRTVYPGVSDVGLDFVVHRARITVSTATDWFPEAQKSLQNRQITETIDMLAYYDSYYHAVLLDGQVVRKVTPHDYGFVPWVVMTAFGAPPLTSSSIDRIEDTTNAGPSIFHNIRHAMDRMNLLMSQMATTVAKAANPPIAVMHDEQSGRPERVGFDAGDTNYMIYNKEAIQVLDTTAHPADVGPLLQALQDDIQRGSIPSILWGGDPANTSGFAVSLMSAAAKDSLFPIIRTMEAAQETINSYCLRLIRDFHDAPVGIIVKNQQNGQWIGGATVNPDDIAQVGTRNQVRYRDLSPKDRLQMMQIGMAAGQSKTLSLRRVREDFFGIDNPELENQRILDEMIYQDADFMKELAVPYSLWQNRPDLFQFWLWLQQYHQQQQQQQIGGQPGPESGPGSGLASGLTSPPVPGMPPTATPAAVGPAPFDALGGAAAASAGASGAQRTPGVSGTGHLFPQGLGVS